MVQAYVATGSLPVAEAAASDSRDLHQFLTQASPGDYVAIHAYIEPSPAADLALGRLRLVLRDTTGLATTVGYGPRFLHSTGQLHKGDGGHGLFVQLTAADEVDVPIPDEAGQHGTSITFGVLKAAQAAGDRQALRDAGRRVIRLGLGRDPVDALARLAGEAP
jgi:hypothetical protein